MQHLHGRGNNTQPWDNWWPSLLYTLPASWRARWVILIEKQVELKLLSTWTSFTSWKRPSVSNDGWHIQRVKIINRSTPDATACALVCRHIDCTCKPLVYKNLWILLKSNKFCGSCVSSCYCLKVLHFEKKWTNTTVWQNEEEQTILYNGPLIFDAVLWKLWMIFWALFLEVQVIVWRERKSFAFSRFSGDTTRLNDNKNGGILLLSVISYRVSNLDRTGDREELQQNWQDTEVTMIKTTETGEKLLMISRRESNLDCSRDRREL